MHRLTSQVKLSNCKTRHTLKSDYIKYMSTSMYSLCYLDELSYNTFYGGVNCAIICSVKCFKEHR